MPIHSPALAPTHAPAYTQTMTDTALPAISDETGKRYENLQGTRIVTPRQGGTLLAIASPERARIVARARWDRVEHVGRRTMAEKAGSTYLAGVSAIVGAQYDIAVSGGKGSHGAASFVLRAAGLLRDRADPAQPGAGADTNDLTMMLTAFRRWRDAHPDAAADLARLAAARRHARRAGRRPGSRSPVDDGCRIRA